ncbi:MAG: amino acid permease [Candidatus Hydrogenedentes bacterium]|nr:amino acid permease [Candidatus Hydrogenedentota bacterium]
MGNQQQNPPPEIHASGLIAKLGLFTACMIIMGNMIGSGVFKKSAPMAAEVQSPGLLLLCWVIAGVVTLFGALSNAEVACIIAEPGGFYQFFKKMYGRGFAFLYGWSSFAVIQTASVASIAYVFGESANSLFVFPRLPESYEAMFVFGWFHPLDNMGVKAFTIATILALTTANYFGVAYGGVIANISTVLKLAGIALVVFLGVTIGNGNAENFAPLGPSATAKYNSSLGLFGAMFAAFLGAFWAYDGWNNITSLGAEVRNAKRNIPLALTIGTLGVMGVYCIVNAVYIYVLPVERMAALTQQQNSIVAVEAMRSFMGDNGATFIAILILLSTFGATNCQLMPHSRVYFAMARDGLFFRTASKVHPTHRTPSNALIIQAVWASLLVMSGTFDQLTDMVIFASFIFYGATAFGVFVLRRTMPDAPRPYKVPGYPFVPAFFVLFCIVLVVVTIIQSPRNAGIGLVLMLSSVPFYLVWRNRKSRP